MNYDKQVKFADQLAFKLDEPPIFQGEEPNPIEFQNNFKQGQAKGKAKSKKGKKAKKLNNFIPPYMKKRPQTAKQKPQPTQQEWNLDTRPQKYFDSRIDPKAQKEYEKEQRERNKKSQVTTSKSSLQVDKNFEEGKYEVGFLKNNGRVGQKFEVYNNIDSLYDSKKQNYAATGYSMKK